MLRNSHVKELVIGANQSLPIVRFFANSVTKTKKKKRLFQERPSPKSSPSFCTSAFSEFFQSFDVLSLHLFDVTSSLF